MPPTDRGAVVFKTHLSGSSGQGRVPSLPKLPLQLGLLSCGPKRRFHVGRRATRLVVPRKHGTETHMGNISGHVWNDALVRQTACERGPDVYPQSTHWPEVTLLPYLYRNKSVS